jgi:ketosteroid isomerase-like protein
VLELRETLVEVWELIVRESVRDVIARYNAYGDSGQMKELLELFTEDAVMDMDGDVTEGRQAISDAFIAAGRNFVAFAKESGAPRDLPAVRHYTSTTVISVESPTEAKARSYFLTFVHKGPDHWGSYTDDFREVDGRWHIARRRVVVEGVIPDGMGAKDFVRRGKGGY